jgi:NAD(P)-binding Rossmann-like domain
MVRIFKAFFTLFCLALHACAFCIPVDFDVIVVGSSPIPLLEALYHSHLGKRVAILEASPVCGGAWKSIEICGFYPVDLGCHTLGHDKQLMHFLEDYIGCEVVSLDNPHLPFEAGKSPNGFYFPHGCYQLMQNMLKLIEKTNIVFLLNHPIESVLVSDDEPYAIVKSNEKEFSTSKIVVTTFSRIRLENPHNPLPFKEKTKFHHLYMLIEDAAAPRFSFRTGIGKGISRLMNLTHFVGLDGTGQQLIVFQTYNKAHTQTPDAFLDILKKNDLVSKEALIMKAENYIYEQSYFQLPQDVKNASQVFEVLKTNHIQDMIQYIPKWKQILMPAL